MNNSPMLHQTVDNAPMLPSASKALTVAQLVEKLGVSECLQVSARLWITMFPNMPSEQAWRGYRGSDVELARALLLRDVEEYHYQLGKHGSYSFHGENQWIKRVIWNVLASK